MKGICFIEPLFHATIEGRKTMTRRIVKLQPPKLNVGLEITRCESTDGGQTFHYDTGGYAFCPGITPRYKVGEVLYLKEPYRFDNRGHVFYKYSLKDRESDGWQNKLFMPASAARYFIRITAVRCERLQEISDEDCIEEGVQRHTGPDDFNPNKKVSGFSWEETETWFYTPREAYAALIDKINGRGTWDSNPWVWVYEYELTELGKWL